MFKLQLPDGLSIEDFLEDYWQKKPLLIRNAIPSEYLTLPANELAGLASEEEIESRLVYTKDQKRWKFKHGPFVESDYKKYGEKDWTLLVQDVDKHIPEVADVLQGFNFIPDWRVDDIMISFAADGGSVGPHTDAYDVFLIQAQGQRLWRINTEIIENPHYVSGLDLKILAKFNPDEEWLLEPGDVLYLPPHLAHWGIAQGECMTWSVGFRSPSHYELSSNWFDYLLEHTKDDDHYSDPPLKPQQYSSEIDSTAIEKMAEVISALPSPDSDDFKYWFGSFVTYPKPGLEIYPPDHQPSLDEVTQRLTNGKLLYRHPYARLAFTRLPDSGALALFYNGEHRVITQEAEALCVLLCEQQQMDLKTLQPHLDGTHAELILELCAKGCWFFDE